MSHPTEMSMALILRYIQQSFTAYIFKGKAFDKKLLVLKKKKKSPLNNKRKSEEIQLKRAIRK